MSFDGCVRVQWHSNNVDVIVLEDFSYTDPAGRVWTARKGQLSNGLSLPRLFEGAVNIGTNFTGPARIAGLLHDTAGYGTAGVTKADADHMFRDAMRELGCPQAQIDALFDAVHLFGGSAYAAAQREAACQTQTLSA